MSNFATDSCHNLFQPGCTFYMDLVVAPGGIPGAFF